MKSCLELMDEEMTQLKENNKKVKEELTNLKKNNRMNWLFKKKNIRLNQARINPTGKLTKV